MEETEEVKTRLEKNSSLQFIVLNESYYYSCCDLIFDNNFVLNLFSNNVGIIQLD